MYGKLLNKRAELNNYVRMCGLFEALFCRKYPAHLP